MGQREGACSTSNCERSPRFHGLCKACYQRWWRASKVNWEERLADAQAAVNGAATVAERNAAAAALRALQDRIDAVPSPVYTPDLPSDPHECATHPEPSAACRNRCRCRCDGCRAADKQQRLERDRTVAAGLPIWVDAAVVRRHLVALQMTGMGRRKISELTGVSTSVISNVMRRRQRRVSRHVANRLLGCRPQQYDGAQIPVGPTRERIDELVAGGFARGEIARYLSGNPAKQQLAIAENKRSHVTVQQARGVEMLWSAWKDGIVEPRGKMPPGWHGPHSHLPRRVSTERTAVPDQLREQSRATRTCGTVGGYVRHRQDGTSPCPACDAAFRNVQDRHQMSVA